MRMTARRKRSWQFAVVLAVVECGRASQLFGGVAFAAGQARAHGPDLGVTMIRSGDDPRPLIVPGQTVTLSIGVSNLRGDAEAHGSVLTVIIPPGLNLGRAEPPPGTTTTAGGGTTLTWNLGTVPAGAFPQVFELDLSAAAELPPRTELKVAANVATSDHDADARNDIDTFTLEVGPAGADLQVGSDLDAVPLIAGPPVKFTAEVGNWGTTVASASALTLSLPAKVSFKSSDPAPTSTSANRVTWQLGDIAPAESRTVAVTIALDMSLGITPGTMLKFAFDASTGTDVNPDNNHLEISRHVELAGPDLKVWLNVQGADEPGELTVGKDVTYVILYGNFGNQTASNVTLSLSLAEGLSSLGTEPKPTGTAKSDRFGGGVMS
jgi:uncharacterized repeat protein (TIGR01451 family)